MSVITFSKGNETSYWKGYWIATSVRIIEQMIYPHHPFPSISAADSDALMSYFETLYGENNFYYCKRDVENKEIYGNRIIWGIKFKNEADEAAFMLHANNGIEI